MARLRPSLRSTETYTETNFLRLYTEDDDARSEPLVTLEHFAYSPAGDNIIALSRTVSLHLILLV